MRKRCRTYAQAGTTVKKTLKQLNGFKKDSIRSKVGFNYPPLMKVV